jgi:aspartate-semialdehyde dehydrogenase
VDGQKEQPKGEDLEEQLAKEEKKKAAEHPLKILDRCVRAPVLVGMHGMHVVVSVATEGFVHDARHERGRVCRR